MKTPRKQSVLLEFGKQLSCGLLIWLTIGLILAYIPFERAKWPDLRGDGMNTLISDARISAGVSVALTSLALIRMASMDRRSLKGDLQIIFFMTLTDFGMSLTCLFSSYPAQDMTAATIDLTTPVFERSIELYSASLPAGLNMTSFGIPCSNSGNPPPPCFVPCLKVLPSTFPSTLPSVVTQQLAAGTCYNNGFNNTFFTSLYTAAPPWTMPDKVWGHSPACTAAGFFFYFFFLSMLLWWWVLSFHLSQRIINLRRDFEMKKVIPFYHVVGFGLPALFSLILVLIPDSISTNVSICYLSPAENFKSFDDLCTYVPVFLTVCYGSVQCVRVVHRLYRLGQKQNQQREAQLMKDAQLTGRNTARRNSASEQMIEEGSAKDQQQQNASSLPYVKVAAKLIGFVALSVLLCSCLVAVRFMLSATAAISTGTLSLFFILLNLTGSTNTIVFFTSFLGADAAKSLKAWLRRRGCLKQSQTPRDDSPYFPPPPTFRDRPDANRVQIPQNYVPPSANYIPVQ